METYGPLRVGGDEVPRRASSKLKIIIRIWLKALIPSLTVEFALY